MTHNALFDVNRDAQAGQGPTLSVPYQIRQTLTGTANPSTIPFTAKVPFGGTISGARMYGRVQDGTVILKVGSTAFSNSASIPATTAVTEIARLATGRTVVSGDTINATIASATGSAEFVIDIEPSQAPS